MVNTDDLLRPYAGQVRVRVGGLLVRDGKLLLAAHRGLLANNATFWSPPGGGWAFGESLREALRREFLEETGLAVRAGRLLHLHEFREGELQALEIFFEALADDAAALPRLGHDPEHATDQQLLTELAWLSPRQLLALSPAQVHPVLRGLLSLGGSLRRLEVVDDDPRASDLGDGVRPDRAEWAAVQGDDGDAYDSFAAIGNRSVSAAAAMVS